MLEMVNINNSSSNIFETKKILKLHFCSSSFPLKKNNPETQNRKIWFVKYQYTEQELLF